MKKSKCKICGNKADGYGIFGEWGYCQSCTTKAAEKITGMTPDGPFQLSTAKPIVWQFWQFNFIPIFDEMKKNGN